MLNILSIAEKIEPIRAAIQTVDRLEELITLHTVHESSDERIHVIVDETGLSLPLIWDNSLPPYLIPTGIPFSDEALLGLIFHLLENDQKAWQYLNGTQLYRHLETQNKLKYGIPLEEPLSEAVDYLTSHNQAVMLHYGLWRTAQPAPVDLYQQAVESAPNDEFRTFSLRELATWHIDEGQLELANQALQAGLQTAISEEAKQALNLSWIQCGMQQLVVPYDSDLLAELKTKIWETLTFYEASGNRPQVGLLLLDATHIANISDSYSEALGYIKRAIDIFEEEGFDELAGTAQMKKGTLLYTWAQQGNPQFFKSAVECYQKALYVFTKETHPAVFADIHQNLAVLYVEMPADYKRRGIWAGVASASFQEALEFYTKESYPYQYGSICNNFGNALTKFPPATHTNNFEKALQYYADALTVRTAEYPYERAITLLNYLEASWNASNLPDVFNDTRYDDMLKKAEEVKTLVNDEEMLKQADAHIENLAKLKSLSS